MDQPLNLPPKAPKPTTPVTLSAGEAEQLYEALYNTVHVTDASQESLDALFDRQEAALRLLEQVFGRVTT